MASSLTLIANPGSASRKYALYAGEHERARLHFEWLQGKVSCTLQESDRQHVMPIEVPDLTLAPRFVVPIFRERAVLQPEDQIKQIGLRIVAPSSYFLQDHLIDHIFVERLEALHARVPIHITATLEELQLLRHQFKDADIVGVSDSGFHSTKPDWAWNYGISLEDADRFEIKRFGYHGLSVASAVHELLKVEKLPPKLVVCHIGSGASVTAVLHGRSVDTTMGYSPLEGVIMSTRSGSIDIEAVRALKEAGRFDEAGLDAYLNNHSGLLGLGGSADLRELLRREQDGDHRSHLALETFVFNLQKAIGAMIAALGGIDALVFTGAAGERSAPIRARIASHLRYAEFILDESTNAACEAPQKPTIISRLAHSKPLLVVPAREEAEMVRHLLA